MYLHADDIGLSKVCNEVVFNLLQQKKLKSISILANARYVDEVCKRLIKIRDVPFFLHLNLIEGYAVSDPKKIPTLVKKNGEFYSRNALIIRLLLRQVDLGHLQIELDAQLLKLKELNVRISGIDSHQHVHALSPISEIVARVVQSHHRLKVRQLSQMKTHSLNGRFKLTLLKLLSAFTYFIYYQKIGLPVSWRKKKWREYSVASWERFTKLDVVKDECVVVHPGLPYDKTKFV